MILRVISASNSDAVSRFLRVARRCPEAPAVSTAGEVTSYGDLLARARTFAARFAMRSGTAVLIALPQGSDAYAAVLGAGLAGCFYTPLNVAAPVEKLRRVARLLQPGFIVGAGELVGLLQAEAPDALSLDPATLDALEQFAGDGSRHLTAYVLFTSGSTGEPKGVVVPRTGLDHYVAWLETLGFGPGDRVSQHPNLAFDLSVFDVYGALCSGAALHPLVSRGDRLMPGRMAGREKLTVWNSVPSVIDLMIRGGQVTARSLGSIRLFSFCGEPLLRHHLEAIFAACPDAVVQNTYGPTEATVSMTAIHLTRASFRDACEGARVPLGDPIPDMDLNLIGGDHDDEGEIVIGGPQLAQGYWGDPEKTAQSFRTLSDPHGQTRGYFTGDWAERRNGRLFFKERIDLQVKVHGYRLELDEVAAAIRACGWPAVCVLKHGEGLAAVVERRSETPLDDVALRAALAAKIEAHAIPETIIEVDRLPINANDKLDRGAVAALLTERLAPAV